MSYWQPLFCWSITKWYVKHLILLTLMRGALWLTFRI